MIAKDNGGVDIPKLEAGVYTAISTAIIGSQNTSGLDHIE